MDGEIGYSILAASIMHVTTKIGSLSLLKIPSFMAKYLSQILTAKKNVSGLYPFFSFNSIILVTQ